MGWNAIFILGFVALCIWMVLALKKRGADKKIAEKWNKGIEDIKDKYEEVKEKVEDKIEDIKK